MMTTFTSAAAFVHNIGTYGTRIKAAEPKALQKAALAATTDIRAAAKPYHITRKSGSKAKLSVGYEASGSKAEIKARGGPWTIIEVGSKSHYIGSGRRRGLVGPIRPGRGKKRSVVVVPGRGVFAYVRHPGHGTIGKPWEIGVAKAKTSAPAAFEKTILQAVK